MFGGTIIVIWHVSHLKPLLSSRSICDNSGAEKTLSRQVEDLAVDARRESNLHKNGGHQQCCVKCSKIPSPCWYERVVTPLVSATSPLVSHRPIVD